LNALIAPTYADIEAAATRIAAVCARTPLLESSVLNAQLGARLLVKAECLQRTGSFKLRGAYNRLVQLDAQQRAHGVVAYSSGNHGQAVAEAARLLQLHATIVMPADAPDLKIERTRNAGAEVILYDRYREDREAIAVRLVAERGSVLVPPFEDPHIIAGGGTLGRELVQQANDLGVRLDALLVNCSGGGLIAGCAIALSEMSPATQVYAAEPIGLDDTARSLQTGARVRNNPEARSICDSLLVPTPGALTFDINRRLLAGAVTVSDAEIVTAMRCARDALGVTVEPGGAAALAAVLEGRIPTLGRTIAVVLTGGNVDPEQYAALLAPGRVSA
jgi:threonine dehydratase